LRKTASQNVPLDVNDGESIKIAIQSIISDSGRIDALVNNVGYGIFGPIEEISIEDIKERLETIFWNN
jgi:short-subunit dehydrogenase